VSRSSKTRQYMPKKKRLERLSTKLEERKSRKGEGGAQVSIALRSRKKHQENNVFIRVNSRKAKKGGVTPNRTAKNRGKKKETRDYSILPANLKERAWKNKPT